MMSNSGESLLSMIAEYKKNYPVSGEINRTVKDVSEVIRLIRKEYEKNSVRIDMTDGISLEFVDWRFNLRASNTEPLIRLNVESRGDRKLMQLKTEELLSKIESF
jgi:phosphomannomutase